jgi:hypothetical protein
MVAPSQISNKSKILQNHLEILYMVLFVLGAIVMMGVNIASQYRFVYVNLDDFVPHDHLLHQIDRMLDFSFIYEKVAHLYRLLDGNQLILSFS